MKLIHPTGHEALARVNTDLSDNWDFWPLIPLPLGEARARLGVTMACDSSVPTA
jgi:hypothetical protein